MPYILLYLKKYKKWSDDRRQDLSNASTESESRKKGEEKAAAQPIRGRILAVDDDPLVLKTVHEFLQDKYNVAVARSGDSAYRFLEKKHADLLLLDYEMPGETGTTVLENIRSIPHCAKLPVIFLTGANDAATVTRIMMLRPQGYLLKPIDQEILISKIEEILGY